MHSFFFSQCSKGDIVPDHTPVDTLPTIPKSPDTLSEGWNLIRFDSTVIITDVVFTSPDSGYFVSDKGMAQTSDGGHTWRYLNNMVGDFLFITADRKIFYTKPKYPNSTLFFSTDRGLNFTTSITNTFTDLYFVSPDTGFIAVDNGILLQTVDGGVNWRPVQDLTGNSWAFLTMPFFLNSKTGWLASNNGVYYSTDSITHWEKSSFTTEPVFDMSYPTVIFTPTRDTVFVATVGSVYRSVNGGKSFDLVFNSKTGGNFNDLFFLNAMEGYVACGRKMFKTSDGGENWERVVYLDRAYLSEIHFTDKNHGWAVGTKGTILIFKR